MRNNICCYEIKLKANVERAPFRKRFTEGAMWGAIYAVWKEGAG
jgi:hypothetical protein